MRDGWPLSKERSCAIAGFKLGDVPALERSGGKEERLSSRGLDNSPIKNSPSCKGKRTRRVLFGPEKGLLGVEKKIKR